MLENLENALVIALEKPEDIEGIRQVNLAAFNNGGEADVVDLLRQDSDIFISLVAKLDNQVVGHILFTPVRIDQTDGGTISGLGLAPLAVRPEYQGQGIGSALCTSGMKLAAQAGYPFVVVLGHPVYYPRFGFEPASKFGIKSAFPDVGEEAFMIWIKDLSAMAGVSGVAYYHPAFDSVT